MDEQRSRPWIIALSVLLPAVVAGLIFGPKWGVLEGLHRGTLPRLNAWINGFTAVLLVLAYMAIRTGRIAQHKRLMLRAVALSVVFLVLYVLQHASFPSARYAGSMPGLYYAILISHIILAAAIVPLVLITLVRGLSARYDRHRRIARWTLPLWLYVSISGVVVYRMIAPFY
ncbi:MAG: DUF420 domain-containing protein [Flavobacteriales bacterium]|nr:DUF420 domain-containing protein [Flavobacteriales bacterium]